MDMSRYKYRYYCTRRCEHETWATVVCRNSYYGVNWTSTPFIYLTSSCTIQFYCTSAFAYAPCSIFAILRFSYGTSACACSTLPLLLALALCLRQSYAAFACADPTLLLLSLALPCLGLFAPALFCICLRLIFLFIINATTYTINVGIKYQMLRHTSCSCPFPTYSRLCSPIYVGWSIGWWGWRYPWSKVSSL